MSNRESACLCDLNTTVVAVGLKPMERLGAERDDLLSLPVVCAVTVPERAGNAAGLPDDKPCFLGGLYGTVFVSKHLTERLLMVGSHQVLCWSPAEPSAIQARAMPARTRRPAAPMSG